MNSFLQTAGKYIHAIPWAYKILFFVVVVLLCLSIFRRKPEKKKQQVAQWSDADYKKRILDSFPDDVKYDYTHLYESIDEICNIAYRYQNCLDAQKADVADFIQRKISESQNQIEQKWQKLQKGKDFHRYIALHYASFTLADNIKKEQEILRSAFVKAKIESDRLGEEINILNKAIPNAHGQKRYELMQQHQKLCAQHKRVCQMKSVFGSRNTQYLNKVKAQNKITMRYREYIIHNFGQRGRAWGQRLKQRKLDQVLGVD